MHRCLGSRVHAALHGTRRPEPPRLQAQKRIWTHFDILLEYISAKAV